MNWIRGATIGRGSSAAVSLVRTVTGELLAVKSAELTCSASLQKEQSFISQLCSPYIVNYMGSDLTYENQKTMYNLFMEYMPAGTLADLIKKQGGSLQESLIKLYTRQILNGLHYLHSKGIVHCDLKSQNILISKDGAKIADLGCAKMIEKNGIVKNKTISGTPIYMAPEVARGEEQGFGTDIWAFGCTIIEMATGFAPWSNMKDPVSALYRIGFSDDVIEIPDSFSSIGKDFLSKCLMRNVKDRWSAEELLQHPFFDGMIRGNQELLRNSPTSVLEQGIWDSMELSGSSFNVLSDCDAVLSLNSPMDRIKKLACSSDFEILNWTVDENWQTVRGIFSEENAVDSQEKFEVENDFEEWGMDVESTLFSVREGEIESLASVDYLLLNHLVDEISMGGSFANSVDHKRLVDEFVTIILDHNRLVDEFVTIILDHNRLVDEFVTIILEFAIRTMMILLSNFMSPSEGSRYSNLLCDSSRGICIPQILFFAFTK